MWLLDVDTRKLVSFLDDREVAGKYAILSHTWEEDEVTFADIHKPDALLMKGYQKIEYTCRQAEQDGLAYAWIDTCCINKDSSAELSESINSMFRWYQKSSVCYVYLSDVTVEFNAHSFEWRMTSSEVKRETLLEALRDCRWSTRGWTLQEMLAPRSLTIFDRSWRLIDTLHPQISNQAIAAVLSEITRVGQHLLMKDAALATYPIAQRISWASHRKTTRVEDGAYSLLGLLGVSMPLLYGEGTRAFLRPQEEILRSTTDKSILLWEPWADRQKHMLFAPDISCFKEGQFDWDLLRAVTDNDNIITNRGLRTTLSCTQLASSHYLMASFGASGPGQSTSRTMVVLRRVGRSKDQQTATSSSIPAFEVIRASPPCARPEELDWTGQKWAQQEVVLLREPPDLIYYIDLDDGLGIASMDERRIGRQVAEIRSGHPIRALCVRGLGTDARHSFELGPRAAIKNESAQWIADKSSTAGQKQEVVRAALWTRHHRYLSNACPLPPGSFILRVWYSKLNLPAQAIYVQSLPTPRCLEDLLISNVDLMDHVSNSDDHRDSQWVERVRNETVMNREQVHKEGLGKVLLRWSKRPPGYEGQ